MKLYAQPYSYEHNGFYFENQQEFDAAMERLKAQGCEEVEIQYIDGDVYDTRMIEGLANKCGHDFELLFSIEYMKEIEQVALSFLFDVGYGLNLEDMIAKIDDVCVFEGKLEDYAYDLLNDCNTIPDYLSHYIAYDRFANDLKLGGDVTIMDGGYIVTNPNDF